MNPGLHATLLGDLVFQADGTRLSCPSRKASWMAAYVLLVRKPQSRAKIASLFWGDAGTVNSLGSLRVALTKLPPPLLKCLRVTRDTIGAAATADYQLDVDEFSAQCLENNIESLQRAVKLYGGELLKGVSAEDAPEFSDWLFVERNRLRQLAHGAHIALAQLLHARGQIAAAQSTAEAWLAHDPANEAMHRLLINWLVQSSGNDRALAQYEVYRRTLAVNHGAAPSLDMRALAERLRDGGRAGLRTGALAPDIAPATSFFGRGDELTALQARLAAPECRLLTLHGLGGVGKTRLALAVAARAAKEGEQFNDGVFVIALDGVASPALFAQTVARACELQPAGNAAPLELLIAFFRRRNALLVLDNLEHLLQGTVAAEEGVARQISRLLGGTGDGLKVLATSREPLRLQEEWLYPLGGLTYAAEVAAVSSALSMSPTLAPYAGDTWKVVDLYAGSDGGSKVDARKFAAVQFFAQRARQAGATFSLDIELPHVVQICTLLQGLPLGIELAASWVGTVPAEVLAAGVRKQAAALANRHDNRSERHHSLGAVVAYSWEHLDGAQRAALSSLAVLKGSFNNEAAREVGYADKTMLHGLADKSLVERVQSDRWRLHEVVRQWAWAQPDRTTGKAASRQQVLLRRRDDYYMGWLRDIHARLDGADEPQALARIDAESSNLREAWQSAARHGDLASLEAAAPAWFNYLECRSFIAEGIAAAEVWLAGARRDENKNATAAPLYYLGLFQRFGARTAEALETMDAALALIPPAASPLLAQALAAKAFLLLLLGRLGEAEKTGGNALVIAGKIDDPALQASACRVLGLTLLQSGRREEGRELQRRALALARSLGTPSLVAAAHNNLALAENHLGNYSEAEAGYESALAFWREIQATANIGRGMHNLGVVATRQGRHEEALGRYRAALAMLRKAGDRNLIALNLMSTGDALLNLDRAAEARETAGQALEMAERDGHMLPALDARIVLAQAAIALGETAEGARQLRLVLDAAGRHGFANVLADAIVSASRLLARQVAALRPLVHAWALSIGEMEEIPLTIRKDAESLAQEIGGEPLPRTTKKPTRLTELAKQADSRLAKIKPARA